VADAYYASRKVILPLLEAGNHLLTWVRSNAVAYLPAPVPKVRKRGRPRKYGPKVPLKSLFDDPETMEMVASPVYGERDVALRLRSMDLVWRPVGFMVRFVAVDHPTRGKCILMCTDLELAATVPNLVWRSFGSWLRTVRPGICPSELVVAAAMRNSLPQLLADHSCARTSTEFIRDRLGLERAEGMRLVA